MDQNEMNETAPTEQESTHEGVTNLQDELENATENATETDNMSDDEAQWHKKYLEINDSHLRLMAEFDNYRKRTLREKSELIKNGGEKALVHLLPVVDDFERALQNMHTTEGMDVKAIADGVELIYGKFIAYLAQQGVKQVEAMGVTFDADLFEAIATIPAPEAELKGKILDCVQTGYTLNEKVIRHAKVVVGE